MSWYLKAYCTEKQDYRIFKLTRIITLEVLADTFDKKSFPELDEMSGQVYSTIVLRFAKEISYRVYDEFDNTQISTEVLIGMYFFKISNGFLGVLSLICFILAIVFFALFIMADKPYYRGTVIAFEGLWQRLSLLFMYCPIAILSLNITIKS